MKEKLSKSYVSKNLLKKSNHKNFTAVKNNSSMMCMCW